MFVTSLGIRYGFIQVIVLTQLAVIESGVHTQDGDYGAAQIEDKEQAVILYDQKGNCKR